MSDNDLSRHPHSIRGRKDAWWYEEAAGINVVVERQSNTTQVMIPWRSIRYALARKAKEVRGE